MSQKRVNFIKQVNIQPVRSYSSTLSDLNRVQSVQGILGTGIEVGDTIVDTEMPTAWLDTTMDWSYGSPDDYQVSVVKGDYGFSQDLTQPIEPLNVWLPFSWYGDDETISTYRARTPDMVDFCFYDGKLCFIGDEGNVAYYDWATETVYNFKNSDPLCLTSEEGGYCDQTYSAHLIEYDGDLVVFTKYGMSSFDGTNWKWFDGSGTGTGPYAVSGDWGGGWIRTLCVYDTFLVLGTNDGAIASWDGSNWKRPDGSGTGTGPYHADVTGDTGDSDLNYVYDYDGYLVTAVTIDGNTGSRISSWDGSNWKLYDGSGTGSGPYRENAGDERVYSLTKSTAYSFVVSGAGSTDDNGTYNENTFFNSKMQYDKVGEPGRSLFYAYISDLYESRWVIDETVATPVNIADIDYYSSSSDLPPDVASWTQGGTGSSPVPTVTLGQSYLYMGNYNGDVLVWQGGNTWGTEVTNVFQDDSYVYSMTSLHHQLVVSNGNGYIAAYDGYGNWRYPDGTGSGPYIFRSDISYESRLFVYSGTLIAVGKYNGDPSFSTYIPYTYPFWSYSDQAGAPDNGKWYRTFDQSRVFLGQTGTYVDPMLLFKIKDRIHLFTYREHQVYSLITDEWLLSTPENLSTVLGSYPTIYQQCAYKGYYIAATSNGVSSHNGTTWRKYDGSGSGNGPYATVAALGGSTIRLVTTHSNYLIVVDSSGNLSSYDGSNWKYYDGSGTGTGPYSSGSLGTTGTAFATLSDGALWIFHDGSNVRTSSWDGTNWKYHDGSGTGNGPYGTSTETGGRTYSIVKYDTYYVFAGASGRVSSWEPSVGWKEYDGDGPGGGPYNNGTAISTTTILSALSYDGMLIVMGNQSLTCRLGSWDGSDWKEYDGDGTGTGPYYNGVFGTSCAMVEATVAGGYAIVAGYGGKVASWDGSDWKNWDGTGTGDGPYNAGAVTGGLNFQNLQNDADKILYTYAEGERIGSFIFSDETWEGYDGQDSTDRIPAARFNLMYFYLPS